jgi:hypothetical protein
VIDAGAFRTARGSASGRIGRSTSLLAVRARRLAARTELERHCAEGGGHCHAGLLVGRAMPQAPAPTERNVFRDQRSCRIRFRPPLPVLHERDDRIQGERFTESSARERRWRMRSSSRSFAPYRRATLALADRSTQWLPRLQSRFKMSVSVPAPLSPLSHAVGWEAVTVRTVLTMLWLVACSVLFNLKLAKSRLHRSRGDASGCSGYPPASIKLELARRGPKLAAIVGYVGGRCQATVTDVPGPRPGPAGLEQPGLSTGSESELDSSPDFPAAGPPRARNPRFARDRGWTPDPRRPTPIPGKSGIGVGDGPPIVGVCAAQWYDVLGFEVEKDVTRRRGLERNIICIG